jgi:hypothetical protein
VRYYFDQPLAMPLDVTEIAVLEEDPEAGQVAAKLEPFDVLESEVRPLIPGWSRSKTPPAVSSDQHVEDFVRLLADETSLDFVSPIFRDPNGNPMIVTGEILVRFWPEVSKRVAEATLLGSVAGEIVATDWGGMDNAFRMRVDSRNGFDVLQAANTLAQRADVKWAEPNMLATAIPHLIPNDAYSKTSIWTPTRPGTSRPARRTWSWASSMTACSRTTPTSTRDQASTSPGAERAAAR